jgi:hypothetical protein
MARFMSVTWVATCIVCSFLFSSPAGATVINYSVDDLGAGEFQYNYTVSGMSFGVSPGFTASGFDVYFDPTLYANLDIAPIAPNADWFVFTIPPDPVLPANGSYTAQAVADNAALDIFSVSFTWLGGGTPGSQPFDVFDPDFLLTEQGTTSLASTAATPVPAAIFNFIIGLVGFAWLRVRRSGAYQAARC